MYSMNMITNEKFSAKDYNGSKTSIENSGKLH